MHLFIVHFPLSNFHFPVSIIHCPLSFVQCSFSIVHCTLSLIHYPPFLYVLFIVHFPSTIVCCPFFINHYPCFIVHSWLSIVDTPLSVWSRGGAYWKYHITMLLGQNYDTAKNEPSWPNRQNLSHKITYNQQGDWLVVMLPYNRQYIL